MLSQLFWGAIFLTAGYFSWGHIRIYFKKTRTLPPGWSLKVQPQEFSPGNEEMILQDSLGKNRARVYLDFRSVPEASKRLRARAWHLEQVETEIKKFKEQEETR